MEVQDQENEDFIQGLSFTGMFKTFRKRNLVGKSLFISLTLGVVIRILLERLDLVEIDNFSRYLGTTGSSIGGGVLGIVIAGLAIISALSNGGLSKVLLKNRLLHRLLFPFWLVSIIWCISILVFIALYFEIYFADEQFMRWLVTISCFVFTYALTSTVGLIGNTIQIGVISAKLEQ